MICTAKLGLGSVCNTGGTCASYAVCDSATSTCVERPVTGASCDPTNGPSCLSGTCDATTNLCTLPVTAGACS
jgi:hypothetical protein